MHVIEWHTASPLWDEALKDGSQERFRQPALLRFDSDGFMDELQALLASDPAKLLDRVARPETGSDPGAGWLPLGHPSQSLPLRLFQPAQQRYYLAAASLNCRIGGLPDRKVDSTVDEKASFVLRRLTPPQPGQPVNPADASTFSEYAWVPEGEEKGWQPLENGGLPLEGEERLPLFPLQFRHKGRLRRVWAGFIPVSSRETFQAAGLSPLKVSPADLAGDPLADPRLAEFQSAAAAAMTSLRQQIIDNAGQISDAEAREVFLFALLDLAEFLQEYLEDAWQAVLGNAWTGAANAQKPVFDRLAGLVFKAGIRWDDALRQVWNQRQDILEGNPAAFVTNGLSDIEIRDRIAALQIGDSSFADPASFNSLVKNALGPYMAPPDAADPVEVPKFDPAGGDLYRIRCLYERPRCKGIHPPLLSAPSRAFQLAGFYDPEAPARPLRIAFPVDTSIAGLRKFPKNVSLLLSNQLRQQLNRVEGVNLDALDNGDIPPGQESSLGMICSLSIPIISICAMILLMIIVQLLNIVFWWLPFFRICLPLNLKK